MPLFLYAVPEPKVVTPSLLIPVLGPAIGQRALVEKAVSANQRIRRELEVRWLWTIVRPVVRTVARGLRLAEIEPLQVRPHSLVVLEVWHAPQPEPARHRLRWDLGGRLRHGSGGLAQRGAKAARIGVLGIHAISYKKRGSRRQKGRAISH